MSDMTAREELEHLVAGGSVRLCRQSGPLDEATAEVIVRFAEMLRAMAAGEPVCRVCGCTEAMACDPVCDWSTPGLCTGCDPCSRALSDGCEHDWTCRPESDTWVCEICGAER